MQVITYLRLFPVRLTFYAAGVALALQGIVFTAGVYGPDLFNEDGPLEWIHFFLITTSALLLLWSSHRARPTYSYLFLVGGLLALCVAVRELDQFLNLLLPKGTYKYLGATFGILAFYQVWKHRDQLLEEIGPFTESGTFFLLAFGLFLVAVLAQLIQQRQLWSVVVTPPFVATVQIAVEETIEAAGYLIILFGAIETFLQTAEGEP